jgi:hypothetical protein
MKNKWVLTLVHINLSETKLVQLVGVSDVPPVSDKGVPVQIVPYLIPCWYKIKLC